MHAGGNYAHFEEKALIKGLNNISGNAYIKCFMPTPPSHNPFGEYPAIKPELFSVSLKEHLFQFHCSAYCSNEQML